MGRPFGVQRTRQLLDVWKTHTSGHRSEGSRRRKQAFLSLRIREDDVHKT